MRVRYTIDDCARTERDAPNTYWANRARVTQWLTSERLDAPLVTAVEWDTDHPYEITLTVITSDGSILGDLTARETTRPHLASRPFPLPGRPAELTPAP